MTADPAKESSLFDPAFVHLDLEATDRDEAISALAKALLAEGKVRESYPRAVLAREAEFPTGLPTPGSAIAIPHTDPEHCIDPAVAVGVLRDTVDFEEMGSPGTTLHVRIVFLLSITKPEDHLQWLSHLASAFESPELSHKLLNARDSQQACQLLQTAVEG